MDERADDNDDDEGVDEWVDDPHVGMSQEDEDELDLTVKPVRLVLVKVSSNSAYRLLTLPHSRLSCRNLPMPSRTPQQSYFLDGFSSSKILQMILTLLTLLPSR